MHRLFLIVLSIFLLMPPLVGQQHQARVDSLTQLLQDKSLSDSSRILTMQRLSYALLKTDPQAGKSIGLETLELAKKLQDTLAITHTYQTISVNCLTMGEIEEGLGYAYEGLNLQKLIHDTTGMASSYANIANVNTMLKEWESAFHFISQAISLQEKGINKKNLADSYQSRAIIQENQHNFEGANEDYLRALAIYKDLGDESRVGMVYLNMASLLDKQKRPSAALDAFFRALEIKKRLGDLEGQGIISVRLATIYTDLGQFDQAEKWARSAMEIGETMNLRRFRRDAYFHLANISESRKQYKKALAYYNQYILIKDTLYKNTVTQRMDDMKKDYEAKAAQQQVEILKQQQAIKDQEIKTQEAIIKNQRFLGLMVGMGFLFALGLSGLLFLNNRQRIRTHRQITDKNQELQQINLAKDKWFSIISHDFRSPLAFLEGALSLINEGNLKETEAHMLTRELEGRVRRTSHLLDNLLYWAQNQRKGIEPRPVITEIRPVVERAIALYTPQISKKHLHIINAVPSQVQAYVDVDMLQLIIRNLISNAVKYSHKDGKIRISAIWSEDKVLIQVKDEGVGIAEADLPRIFKLYDGVSRSGTDHERGTGLGLSLAKDFTEQNSGRLEVTSELSEGTTFSLELPCQETNLLN